MILIARVCKQVMKANENTFTIWAFGFRPFFIGAGLFAVCYMLLWLAVYHYGYAIQLIGMSLYQWHAHEMVFGYSLAVIAGFLLTAVSNWTGVQTIQHGKLATVFITWLLARIAFNTGLLPLAAILDLAFLGLLTFAVAHPILIVKQWRQAGILTKLALLLPSNALFYAGALGGWQPGVAIGLYSGLFLVVALILTMARRLLPFFIERGVGYSIELHNPRWLDITSLLGFLAFTIAYLTQGYPLTYWLALLLALVTLRRLVAWHTPGIWQKPLLWSLYLAIAFMGLGFLLIAANLVSVVPWFQAIHAIGIGGIGLITLSIMSRVSLAHTGRDIHAVPRLVPIAFTAIIVSTLLRAIYPLLSPESYGQAIMAAQGLWIFAFTLFLLTYVPILIRPRRDGKPG